MPPGIGVAPGGRATAALSLEEEVRAARSRGLPQDRRTVEVVPGREYASNRSRAADLCVNGDSASQPPHLRITVAPRAAPRSGTAVPTAAADGKGSERGSVSTRTHAAPGKDSEQRESRGHASERNRVADRGPFANAGVRHANGRADGGTSAGRRTTLTERAPDGKADASDGPAAKPLAKRPDVVPTPDTAHRREPRTEQHRETSNGKQPEKKGWGSYMRERARESSIERAAAEPSDRQQPQVKDGPRLAAERGDKPGLDVGQQPAHHGGGGGGGGGGRQPSDGGGHDSGADRRRSGDGRQASGEAGAKTGVSGASPLNSAAAGFPLSDATGGFTEDAREWWYMDPKVGMYTP